MKNKIFLNITTGVLACAMLSGCLDLDEEPIGTLAPETFFTSVTDAEASVNGAYTYLASESVYGRRLINCLQLLGDMCDIGDTGTAAERVQINGFTYDSSNGMPAKFWPSIYKVISAANSAIDGIPQVDMDENYKNQLIAEAKVIRAWCYYDLVRLFGDVPYIDQFVTNPTSVATISKTPAAEIYQHIITDCKAGEEFLPDKYTPNVRSRPSKGTAQTILASVYMTLGEWANAATYAEKVITNASAYGYSLLPDFQDLWDANNAEHAEQIWAIDFRGGTSASDGVNVDYMVPMTGVRNAKMAGWSVVVPSPGVYDSFDDRDYRKKVSFLTETTVGSVMTPYTAWTWPRIHMAKWCLSRGANCVSSDGATSDHNYNLFRYAEVLLIAAECLNEANNGPTANAYTYINAVRARARNYGGTQTSFPANLQTGMTQAEFRAAVREERRLELAFEWKRWFDLVRWGIAKEAFTGPNSLEPHANFQDYHTLLPIPQTELDLNPNLLPQNNGY